MSEIPEGWHVEFNRKTLIDRQFDYEFWHDDHDGENGLCGTAGSIEDAIEQINEIEGEVE